jgi:D-beta-D-heptose 7-phosphate kinase/D-beta-D-heptose 1-phosphate adenosyltransferase
MIVDPRTKCLSWDDVQRWRSAQAGHIVFTNGVFDLLHRGHIDVLHGARAEGSALIVGLNSDASVRRLKGPTRPVRSAVDRAYVLGALAVVDVVCVFEQDTPHDLIATVLPDVLVKGGDYGADTIVGSDIVRARGGRVVIIPLAPGHSTTATIARLDASPSA